MSNYNNQSQQNFDFQQNQIPSNPINPINYSNYQLYTVPVYFPAYQNFQSVEQTQYFQFLNSPGIYYINPSYSYATRPNNLQVSINYVQNNTFSTNTNEQMENLINATQINCNCSKSGCRKDYCKCFRNGKMCGIDCNCTDCYNIEQYASEITVKRRGKTKCNCKKSECSSKYCDCLANGLKCGADCNCTNCKNQ